MAIGTMEGIIIGIIAFIFVGLFGRGMLKNFLRAIFGAKKDFEEIKKEMETPIK